MLPRETSQGQSVYYLQLEKDFFETAPYCDIDESNNSSFSIKYLQLHLSICSEIDTICKSLCKELDNSLEMSECGISDYIEILKSSYTTFFDETVPSVDKGAYGFAPQICDSAALLSLSVRPVRFVPVPCRITNLRRKTPSDPKYRILVAGKATE